MNKPVLATALLGLALTGSVAAAADLPVKAARPMVAAESWTGFYIGGYVGGAFGTSDWIDVDDARLVGQSDSNLRPSGFIAGGQAGYNYQINQLVVGIEAEGGWTNFSDTKNQPPDLCFPLGPAQSCKVEARWFAMLTGRAGLAWQRNLLYAKGGVALAGFHYENPCVFCSSLNWLADETRVGWTIGAGIEHIWNRKWSTKLEYNYLEFGTDRPIFFGTTPGDNFREDITNHVHMVKLGVNLKIDMPD